MALYIGFVHVNQHWSRIYTEKLVSGEWTLSPGQAVSDAKLVEKVEGLPAFLESLGVRLIGRYRPVGFNNDPANPPYLQIIDTDNEDDLQAINAYYVPYFSISYYRYIGP